MKGGSKRCRRQKFQTSPAPHLKLPSGSTRSITQSTINEIVIATSSTSNRLTARRKLELKTFYQRRINVLRMAHLAHIRALDRHFVGVSFSEHV